MPEYRDLPANVVSLGRRVPVASRDRLVYRDLQDLPVRLAKGAGAIFGSMWASLALKCPAVTGCAFYRLPALMTLKVRCLVAREITCGRRPHRPLRSGLSSYLSSSTLRCVPMGICTRST